MTGALPAWVDGRLVAPGEPAIPADDQGFLLGLAVYETFLAEDGRLYFLARHLERLADGARVLGIDAPPAQETSAALSAYVAALGPGAFAVRLSLSRGSPGGPPRVVIGARPADVDAARGVAAAIASEVKPIDPRLEGTKSSNRLRNVLAREAAQAAGAWDALIPTVEGDLSEGTVSNLFVASGGALVTPPLARGALPGVVRGELIAACREEGIVVREERVEVADLRAADEVFLTNSVVRVAPVRAVLGVRDDLPGADGPLARRALALLRGREALESRHLDAPGG